MSDAMQIAQQRQKEYASMIAKKQTEIDELKEHIEDLENFIEFGASLVGKPAAKANGNQKVTSQPVKPTLNDEGKEWDSNDVKAAVARAMPTRS